MQEFIVNKIARVDENGLKQRLKEKGYGSTNGVVKYIKDFYKGMPKGEKWELYINNLLIELPGKESVRLKTENLIE